MNVIQNRELV